MDKRYLIIIGTIAGLTIIGLILFWTLGGAKPASEGKFPEGGAFPSSLTGVPGQMPSQGPANPPPTIFPGQQKSLTQLTKKAVSGAIFTEKDSGDKTKTGIVRYFEKATGHIYDIDLKTLASVRVSGTTIPGIFEVYWSNDGNQAIIRYVEKNETGIEDTVRNFSVLSMAATSTRGTFLPSSIKTIASSPKEDKIFYLAPFENIYVGITSTFEDKKQKQILTTPFGEFLANWPSDNIISLVTKPSAETGGYLFKLNPSTGSLESVLKDIKGLTGLWSRDAESILYGESFFGGMKTFLYGVKDKKIKQFAVDVPPEKCAWSAKEKGIIYCAVPSTIPSGNYPDDWYQGIISFSDRVWRIDVLGGATEIISSETDNVLDLVNLFLDKNEEYLFFQNKIDGTLWSLVLR